jgi:hypothetical protein
MIIILTLQQIRVNILADSNESFYLFIDRVFVMDVMTVRVKAELVTIGVCGHRLYHSFFPIALRQNFRMSFSIFINKILFYQLPRGIKF